VAFIIGPNGKVIHKYYKLMTSNNAMECNLSPHDVYDDFVEKFGDNLDAFFPVADTEIGKLGVFTCYDGNFPEIPRGLAINGAEVLIRPAAWPDPYQDSPMDLWELQNRMRALENNCYLIAANQGGGGYMGTDINSGHSMIVDYKGRILTRTLKTGDTLIYATINVDELRRFRQTAHAYNFLPALRTEVFGKIYEKPIWPKNHWLEKPPANVIDLQTGFRKAKDRLKERKVFPSD
jgi:predicted amidohydrolase